MPSPLPAATTPSCLKGDADTVSVLRGSGNRITLSGTVGTMVLAGKNTTVDGTGKIGTVDTRMVAAR